MNKTIKKNALKYWRRLSLFIRKNPKTVIVFISLYLFWLLPRAIDLGISMTADEPTWIARSHNFLKAIINLRFEDTRQYRIPSASHPGVTTMWLGSIGVAVSNIVKNLFQISFATEFLLVKLPLIIFISFVFIISIAVVYLLLGLPAAFLVGIFMALDPFLIAYTRLIHLDGTLALLMFASFVTYLLGIKRKNRSIIVISGIIGGLAFLTKVPAFSLIPIIFLLSLFGTSTNLELPRIIYLRKLLSKSNIRKALEQFAPWLAISFITFVILWPAMWVNPVTSFFSLFGAAKGGVLYAHGTKRYILNPLFYINSILLHTPSVTLALLLAAFGLGLIRRKFKNISLTSSFVFLIYFVLGMTLSAKKGERYILPIYPHINYLAGFGAYFLTTSIKKPIVKHAFYLVLTAFLLWQTISLHPYYLSYYNPIFPEPEKIGFGEGLEKGAFYLNEKENAEQIVVSSWYPEVFGAYFKGKTLDLRKRNESVDYVILYRGMRGRLPDDPATKILEEFEKEVPEKTIYINNIEYVWIYN